MEGCGECSSFDMAVESMPIADSEGGILEWPGRPFTVTSNVAEPFSETPTLKKNA